MKCEMCHQREAATAVHLPGDGEDQELYVCRECAKQARLRRQKKSQRTRKASGLPPGVSISVTNMGGGEPPPLIAAIMDAVNGMVSDLEKATKEKNARREPEYSDYPCSKVASPYRVGEYLHLEGLHLIGELEAVRRAARALRMQLVGVDADGVRDAGHVFKLKYSGSADRAGRVLEDIVAQERNARVRLFEEMPRVFGDSLCRALAVLKNCRLLSPGEFFDLLSPLRLGALEDVLEGVTRKEIEKMMAGADLSSREDGMDVEERDRVDAERADEMNRRFEDVVLDERSEEKFL